MSEIKILDTLDPQPFKNLAMSFGGVPTDFKEAMTSYEIMAYLVHYIDTTLIPQINDLTTNYDDLIKAFAELKDYVDEFLRDYEDLKTQFQELKIYVDAQVIAMRAETRETIRVSLNAFREEILGLMEDYDQTWQLKIDQYNAELNERIDDIEAGLIIMTNPVTGQLDTIQNVINSIYDLTRTQALTAKEYDDLELTAKTYDDYEITALAYDTLGKNILS